MELGDSSYDGEASPRNVEVSPSSLEQPNGMRGQLERQHDDVGGAKNFGPFLGESSAPLPIQCG